MSDKDTYICLRLIDLIWSVHDFTEMYWLTMCVSIMIAHHIYMLILIRALLINLCLLFANQTDNY